MPKHVFAAVALCAVISIPIAAQERVHLPAPGETSEWCLTPIVWPVQDQAIELDQEAENLQRRAYLGVDLASLTDARAKELKIFSKGALIQRVMPNSPAEKAGLKANDVVVAIDGKAIASDAELRDAIGDHESGQTVTLEVIRDGKRQTVQATLGSRFALGDRGFLRTPNGMELFRGRMPEGFAFGDGEPYVMLFPGAPRLGVSVLPMTNDLRDYFGAEHDKGVLVSAVSKGSAAERAGIQTGDVIVSIDGEAVSRAGEISRVLASKRTEGPRTVEIVLVRNHSAQTVTATVDAPRLMNEE